MEKLFLENDQPVVLTVNRIPADLLNDAIDIDDTAPLFALLEQHSDHNLAYYLSEIVPAALGAHEAETLGVATGTPAISFQEIGFGQDNEPVVQATSYFRDDLIRLRLIRRKSGA